MFCSVWRLCPVVFRVFFLTWFRGRHVVEPVGMYLNARHTQRVEILAFMAGREQKSVGVDDVTAIKYDTFILECKRASRAPGGPTLDNYCGQDRKVTLSGTVEGETVKVEVVLDAMSIEVLGIFLNVHQEYY